MDWVESEKLPKATVFGGGGGGGVESTVSWSWSLLPRTQPGLTGKSQKDPILVGAVEAE